MGTYYIKDLESITGIKAHTIRIWEQRYHLVLPKRTDTNIRYYNDDDVKLLLNIALLNKKGLKISKIANLSRSEIHSEAFISCQKCHENDDLINSLILATYNLNENAFNTVFSQYIHDNGFENALVKLGFPFLNRIGDLWVANAINPALEHFASNIIKKKIQLAIEGLDKKVENPKKFILVLGPGEYHDIGLLFANYIIRSKGHETLYLGTNTPLVDFESVLDIYKTDYILSIFTNCQADVDPAKFVDLIFSKWPNIKLLLSGGSLLSQLEKFSNSCHFKQNVTILNSPDELSQFMDNKL
jgi:DNA-binding transcriptional MerR regulator